MEIRVSGPGMDLHSGRSQVNLDWMAEEAVKIGLNQNMKSQIQSANTAMEALELAQGSTIDLPSHIALKAQEKALGI